MKWQRRALADDCTKARYNLALALDQVGGKREAADLLLVCAQGGEAEALAEPYLDVLLSRSPPP